MSPKMKALATSPEQTAAGEKLAALGCTDAHLEALGAVNWGKWLAMIPELIALIVKYLPQTPAPNPNA